MLKRTKLAIAGLIAAAAVAVVGMAPPASADLGRAVKNTVRSVGNSADGSISGLDIELVL